MAYIDKDLLLNCLEDLAHENLIGNDNDTFISLPEAQDRIEELSTEDVVEVVRCKDCVHLLKDLTGIKHHYCMRLKKGPFYNFDVKLDDFCSYGERKEVD